jgi:hypothetical protein
MAGSGAGQRQPEQGRAASNPAEGERPAFRRALRKVLERLTEVTPGAARVFCPRLCRRISKRPMVGRSVWVRFTAFSTQPSAFSPWTSEVHANIARIAKIANASRSTQHSAPGHPGGGRKDCEKLPELPRLPTLRVAHSIQHTAFSPWTSRRRQEGLRKIARIAKIARIEKQKLCLRVAAGRSRLMIR